MGGVLLFSTGFSGFSSGGAGSPAAAGSEGPALRRFRLARKAAASLSGEVLGIAFTSTGALSFAESLRYSSAPFRLAEGFRDQIFRKIPRLPQ
jgi:hypothetical protein